MSQQMIAEVTDCDLKSAVETRKPKSWLKSVSAFANTVGGKLIFGISNETHKAIGLDDAQKDVEDITRLIKDRIDPLPDFTVDAQKKDDKDIVIVAVKPGMSTPYCYRADGVREAYIRIGDQSIPAPAYVMNELILKGTNRTYDGLATSTAFEDASFTVLRATFKMRTDSNFTDGDFRSFGLVAADNVLTNAGALLADEPLIRHSRLFCTRWTGLNKDDAQDDAEFSGSLLLLLREGEAFIKRHNRVAWEKTANDRIDKPSFAERAVTEALVNAFIHRDYLMLGSEVHIDIYDDRCVISSPGAMFDNGTLPANPAKDPIESRRRNPILADLFQRMGYMERRGSGLHKICEMTEIQDNFKPEFLPTFEAVAGGFRVTLWDMNYTSTDQVSTQVSTQVEKLMEALGDDELSSTELQAKMGFSERRSFQKNYLNPALEAGVIERTIPDKPNSRLQKYRRAV